MSTCPAKKTLYSSCEMRSQSGQLMALIAQRKAEWFLDRNLATIVGTDPLSIQLTFEPNGMGKHGYAFYMTPIDNVCVVCGSEDELTRHHVVPKCFKRYLPKHIKENSSHDVLAVCVNCHNEYERKAQNFKMSFLEPAVSQADCRTQLRAIRSAVALINHHLIIPEARQGELKENIKAHLKQKELTDEDIARVASQKGSNFCSGPDWKKAAEEVGDIEEFIRQWRTHFLTTMKPQFMPKHWDVEHPIHTL